MAFHTGTREFKFVKVYKLMCLWISSQQRFLSVNDLTRFGSLLTEMFAYELRFFFFATKDKCEVMVNLLSHSFQLHIVNRKLLIETCK